MLFIISLHNFFLTNKKVSQDHFLISLALFVLAILPIKSFSAGYDVQINDGPPPYIGAIYSDPYFTFQNVIINPTSGSTTPNDPLTGLGGDYHFNTYFGIILNTGSYTLNEDGSRLGWNEGLSAILISAPRDSSVSNISFTNNSSIGADGGSVTDTGIVVDGSATSSTIVNNGNIFANNSGIYNAGANTTITNSSSLNCNGFCSQINPYISGNYGIQNLGSISSINNALNALITGGDSGIYNLAHNDPGDSSSSSFSIQTITNNGSISGFVGIRNGSIYGSGSLINQIINTSSGSISGSAVGIYNLGTINSIENAGTINNIQNDGDPLSDLKANINAITNTGNIDSIVNTGTINTLNNLQSNLAFSGNLPTNYNIIINSTSAYGKLIVDAPSGTLNFGIYPGSIITKNFTYTGVLSNADPSSTSGKYNGYTYTLIQETDPTIWDLTFTGVSASNSNLSLEKQSGNLMSAFNLQKASINLGLNYDCTTFDSNGVCVGVGGRYTSLDINSQFNNSSAMVVTSIKLGDNFRVGGYLDQNVSSKLTDISLSNNKGPLGGLFIVLAQNDKTHQGYELRLAGNYQSKHADISREVIGDSEAGSGNASLESYGALAQISYGFKASDKILLTQYLGVRYSQIKRSAYVEGSNVSTPLSYSELKDESTAALAGLKLNIALADDFNIQGHLGIEDDVHQKIGNLTATGIDGLAPIVMSNDKNKFRGVAGLGAALNISKYQVLRGSVNYQQLPYQTKAATTAMFTYEIGL